MTSTLQQTIVHIGNCFFEYLRGAVFVANDFKALQFPMTFHSYKMARSSIPYSAVMRDDESPPLVFPLLFQPFRY